jgi:hypothetical protein
MAIKLPLVIGPDGRPQQLQPGDTIQMTVDPTYAGIYPVNVRQSAATAAGAIVWGLYNSSSTKVVYVRSMFFQMFFDGAAAATLMKYELVKYIGVTAFTGGVVLRPLNKRTSLAGALVSSARVLDTGLTVTAGVAQGTFSIGAQGRVTQLATNFNASELAILQNERGILNSISIELALNELLAIRQSVVSVIGDNIVGYVEIAED